MQRRDVVTCFLTRGGQVLLLRRSARVRTYPGRWAAVSGSMQGGDPVAEALREVAEETALAAPSVRVVRAGEPLRVPDAALGVEWVVHPVLAELAEGAEPRLDWEHTEARWVEPSRLRGLDTVPALAEALEQVLHA